MTDSGEEEEEVLSLYVRSGFDGKKYGACPFSHRIFMLLIIKATQGDLKFVVATVPPGKPPEELRRNGLRNLPAIIHGEEGYDTVEEILEYIEAMFPLPLLPSPSNRAEEATRDFFSKFCFYIKSVSRDCTGLSLSLSRLDGYLSCMTGPYLAGQQLSALDCEILPKLHHLRVAAAVLKGYFIPSSYTGIWKYLHTGYNSPVFVKSCPPDQEICLHWASRPDTPNISTEDLTSLTRDRPKFSLDVPALATPITIQ